MGKTLLTFKGQCANATKNQNGASLQFARNIEKTPQGQPAAREVVVINVKDQKEADKFQVIDNKGNGPEYTITVTD
jgi:hypothetical protein